MKSHTLEFTFDRSTKNTHLFKEQGDNPIVGSLYIKKAEAGGDTPPKSLTVVITAK
jgi:hypothetical protein